MLTLEKIDEWIEEVEKRPGSAPLIIKFIANRLRDLAKRNEELLAENIELLNGKRVESYEQRITYLEYQLELVKRQFGGELPEADSQGKASAANLGQQDESTSILIYNNQGQVARFNVQDDTPGNGKTLGRLDGDFSPAGEPPGIAAVSTSEELLLVFSSGRVASIPVSGIPSADTSLPYNFNQAVTPDEPRAGETLACLVSISKLAFSDFIIQSTRRGYVKKIAAAMAQSILANHFIGTGVKLPADQTFAVTLCRKDDRLVFVSQMGYMLLIEARRIPFSIEEAMRLRSEDHLVASFELPAGHALVVATQMGKLIHRTEDALEAAESLKTRGQPVFSTARREQGVQVVSAAAAHQDDWAATVSRDGKISLHAMSDLFGSGTIPLDSELLAFTTFTPHRKSR